MEVLLMHLLGDYVLQSDKMALNKTRSHKWAFSHALLYAIGFVWLAPSLVAWLVIFGTHFLIDRYRLAAYWIQFYNGTANRENSGYGPEKPAWLAVWPMIIIDSTFHLLINYGALRWL